MGHHPQIEPGLAVEVGAYSGGRGEEEPRSVVLGGVRREIRSILACSRLPSGRIFRVATDDGQVHELFCRESDASWWLVTGPHPVG